MEYVSLYQEYVKPELLVVTPALYILAKMMDNSHLDNRKIPWYLLLVSILLSCLYIFSTSDISSPPKVMNAIFTTVIQGVLLSGATIYGGILGKLLSNKKTNV